MESRVDYERSHVPLHKWVYAMYLTVTSRKGISSLRLPVTTLFRLPPLTSPANLAQAHCAALFN